MIENYDFFKFHRKTIPLFHDLFFFTKSIFNIVLWAERFELSTDFPFLQHILRQTKCQIIKENIKDFEIENVLKIPLSGT